MGRAKAGIAPDSGLLQRGRAHYARRAWADAFDALTQADGTTALGGDDLERLAMSAFLIGRETEYAAAPGQEIGSTLCAARMSLAPPRKHFLEATLRMAAR